MLKAFLALAARSPGRQRLLRRTTQTHLLVVVGAACMVVSSGSSSYLGSCLLLAGIVEGAVLLGWRLTQLPRSQALEFLLASPVRPGFVFLAEALSGLGFLGLVTWSGLPMLVLLVLHGRLEWIDLVPLLVLPWTWGAMTGIGLTVWAYEPRAIRRWGERGFLGLIVLYLSLGLLLGENLRPWMDWLEGKLGMSGNLGLRFHQSLLAFHRFNPFSVLEFWVREGTPLALERLGWLEGGALGCLGLLLFRAGCRFKKHFHERHYQPSEASATVARGTLGDRPLTWWAVRRVLEYSGRVNFWLAGGFGLLYGLYVMAGPHWPAQLGRWAFVLVDQQAGGIPGVATALLTLAAVPAAFQYGLWDSNAQDRSRRLELLLLTRLNAGDYWQAASASAWRRGRGYFGIACWLGVAAVVGGQAGWVEIACLLCSGVVLWGLYFALGFQAFSRGLHANSLGLLLTVGLPLLSFGMYRAGWKGIGALLPPGGVYAPASGMSCFLWLPGLLLGGMAALVLSRQGLAHGDAALRCWYNRHHGRREMD